jgi:hypothetical protein
MEKIISISTNGFSTTDSSYYSYDGCIIVTTEQTIKLGICNTSYCCERWDATHSPDELAQFIDKELLNIEESKEPSTVDYYDGGGEITVDIITSAGTLKITLGNSHNGYYSHNYIIESTQFSSNGYL